MAEYEEFTEACEEFMKAYRTTIVKLKGEARKTKNTADLEELKKLIEPFIDIFKKLKKTVEDEYKKYLSYLRGKAFYRIFYSQQQKFANDLFQYIDRHLGMLIKGVPELEAEIAKIKGVPTASPTEERVKICPYCGSLEPIDVAFCGNCGKRLTKEKPEEKEKEEEEKKHEARRKDWRQLLETYKRILKKEIRSFGIKKDTKYLSAFDEWRDLIDTLVELELNKAKALTTLNTMINSLQTTTEFRKLFKDNPFATTYLPTLLEWFKNIHTVHDAATKEWEKANRKHKERHVNYEGLKVYFNSFAAVLKDYNKFFDFEKSDAGDITTVKTRTIDELGIQF